jgi:hypothetical protein
MPEVLRLTLKREYFEQIFFFQKFKSLTSSRSNNWGKKADWLHKEADAYQDALQRVMGG